MLTLSVRLVGGVLMHAFRHEKKPYLVGHMHTLLHEPKVQLETMRKLAAAWSKGYVELIIILLTCNL